MKTTKKDYSIFKQDFMRWAERLNVTCYNIHFNIAAIGDRLAQIGINESSKTAWVAINQEIEADNSEEKMAQIYTAAAHECFHLFLEQLVSLAEDAAPKWVTERINEEMTNTFTHLVETAKGSKAL